MKELKYLNKYLKKYWLKLFVGIIITIVARLFSLVTPSYINKSIGVLEGFFANT